MTCTNNISRLASTNKGQTNDDNVQIRNQHDRIPLHGLSSCILIIRSFIQLRSFMIILFSFILLILIMYQIWIYCVPVIWLHLLTYARARRFVFPLLCFGGALPPLRLCRLATSGVSIIRVYISCARWRMKACQRARWRKRGRPRCSRRWPSNCRCRSPRRHPRWQSHPRKARWACR